MTIDVSRYVYVARNLKGSPRDLPKSAARIFNQCPQVRREDFWGAGVSISGDDVIHYLPRHSRYAIILLSFEILPSYETPISLQERQAHKLSFISCFTHSRSCLTSTENGITCVLSYANFAMNNTRTPRRHGAYLHKAVYASVEAGLCHISARL